VSRVAGAHPWPIVCLVSIRFDYEDSLEPFLSKLKNFTSASSANASVFRNTSLSFLESYSPLLVNETAQVSHVPESGRKDAFELGKQFEKYLGHLLPPWTDNKESPANQTYKLWAATAQRDLDTAVSFQQGLFSNSTYNSSEIVEVGEGKLAAGNTLTPHKTCKAYSGSAGSKEQKVWKNLYAQPIADRLNAEGQMGSFNWTVKDVFAAQQLCGYDTVIAGTESPWCNTTAFTNEDWLNFEYANDLMYHSSIGYGFPASPSLGMPYLLAVSDFLLPSNDFTGLTANFTQNSNYTTPDESKVPSKDQALYLSFAHREEPAFLATALGLFNDSTRLGVSTNETFSTTSNDKERLWKTSELLPFLGHVGIERVSCPAMAAGNQSYVRV
jgi:acid phosphatase